MALAKEGESKAPKIQLYKVKVANLLLKNNKWRSGGELVSESELTKGVKDLIKAGFIELPKKK